MQTEIWIVSEAPLPTPKSSIVHIGTKKYFVLSIFGWSFAIAPFFLEGFNQLIGPLPTELGAMMELVNLKLGK